MTFSKHHATLKAGGCVQCRHRLRLNGTLVGHVAMTHGLLLGHSHIVCIQQAVAELGPDLKNSLNGITLELAPIGAVHFQPNFTPDGALNPKIRQLVTAKRFDVILSVIGGNTHCCLGLVNNPKPYDFVHPELPDLLPDTADTQCLPYGLMLDILHEMAQDITPLLPAIRALSDKPIWHLQPPPPVADPSHLRRNALHFAELIRAYGLAHPARAYRFWRLQCSMMEQICAPLDITPCPPPRAALDEDGMLAQPCWTEDPTHAGPAYGRALLAQIAALLTPQIAAVP